MVPKFIHVQFLVMLSAFCYVHGQLSYRNSYIACPSTLGQQLTAIPHPYICTKFYYCSLGNLIEFNCPNGLYFDRITSACTSPETARCNHTPYWTTNTAPLPITTAPLPITTAPLPITTTPSLSTVTSTSTSTTATTTTGYSTFCGELNISGTIGNLTSPNYPGNYHSSLNCYYTIIGPSGTFLTLHFNFLDVEYNYDYIYIFDGPSTNNSQLAYLTGGGTVHDLHASSNVVLVYFHTDGIVQHTGFHLTFAASTCSALLEYGGSSGTIVSPNFPFANYPSNLNCYYRISANPSDFPVAIIINTLHLETSTTCVWDFLRIHDGPTTSSPILATLCGSTPVNNIVYASSNQVLVYFKTDGGFNLPGFNISYVSVVLSTIGTTTQTSTNYWSPPTTTTTSTAGPTTETNTPYTNACETLDFSGTIGNLTSPNYPNLYQNNLNCYYSITGPAGTFISLHVNHLSLESGFDSITVFNGISTNNTSLAWITGYNAVNDVHASTNAVLVYFHTDLSVQRSGFHLTYTASTCAGQLEYGGSFGTIVSPNFPFANYPSNLDCYYRITTIPSSSIVMIRINFLDVESESTCNWDSLRIYDGPNTSSSLLANLCGFNSNNTLIYAPTNQALVYFKTDSSVNRAGFNISYTSMPLTTIGTTGWDTTQEGTNAEVSTEGTTEETTSEGTTEETTSEGTTEETASEGTTEETTSEGTTDETTREGSLQETRSEGTADVTRSEGTTDVTRSEGTTTVTQITAINATFCDELIGNTGSLTSPNYPDLYPNNFNCYYLIRGPNATYISIHVNFLNVENGYDYIDIFNGESTNNSRLARITGIGTVDDVHASTNIVLIYFHTDGSVQRGGFHLTYTASTCAGQLEYGGSSGTIVSPSYPFAFYPNNLNCSYKIVTAPSDYQTEIQINFLDLENHPNCVWDILRIYDGPTSSSPILANLCGSNPSNNSIHASSNQVLVYFKTDISVVRPGFNISYSSVPPTTTTLTSTNTL